VRTAGRHLSSPIVNDNTPPALAPARVLSIGRISHPGPVGMTAAAGSRCRQPPVARARGRRALLGALTPTQLKPVPGGCSALGRSSADAFACHGQSRLCSQPTLKERHGFPPRDPRPSHTQHRPEGECPAHPYVLLCHACTQRRTRTVTRYDVRPPWFISGATLGCHVAALVVRIGWICVYLTNHLYDDHCRGDQGTARPGGKSCSSVRLFLFFVTPSLSMCSFPGPQCRETFRLA